LERGGKFRGPSFPDNASLHSQPTHRRLSTKPHDKTPLGPGSPLSDSQLQIYQYPGIPDFIPGVVQLFPVVSLSHSRGSAAVIAAAGSRGVILIWILPPVIYHISNNHHKTQTLLTPIAVVTFSQISLHQSPSSCNCPLQFIYNYSTGYQSKRIDITKPPNWLNHAPHPYALTMLELHHHRCHRAPFQRKRRNTIQKGNWERNS